MKTFFKIFFFYTGGIIPMITLLLDKLITNNYTLCKIYFINIFTLYFIMLMYVILYFSVLKKIKFIREMIEGSKN